MKLDEKFLEELGKKYDDYSAWNKEKDKVKIILESIGAAIEPRYSILRPLNVGGAGLVVIVFDNNMCVELALKFPRPIDGQDELLTTIMEREIQSLAESAHENIVSIYYKDKIKEFGKDWPFYIMEYIQGADDADHYLRNHKPDYKQFIDLL